jgi:hypothetical protein
VVQDWLVLRQRLWQQRGNDPIEGDLAEGCPVLEHWRAIGKPWVSCSVVWGGSSRVGVRGRNLSAEYRRLCAVGMESELVEAVVDLKSLKSSCWDELLVTVFELFGQIGGRSRLDPGALWCTFWQRSVARGWTVNDHGREIAVYWDRECPFW